MTVAAKLRSTIGGPLLGGWPMVRISGAAPDEAPVEITLDVVDHAGHRWSTVGPPDQPATQSPAGAAPSRPLWSTLRGPKGGVFSISGPTPIEAIVSIDDGHNRLAETHSVPITTGPVSMEPIDEPGFRGRLIAPTETGPGVVLLGGSEGGFHGAVPTALALADQGWWCLVVGYLGVPGAPEVLSEVPIEPVMNGINWLRDRPEVTTDTIALWGASKGAEAALLVAANHNSVSGLVSVSGSPVVFEGLDHRTRASSWSWNGEPVPFQRMRRLRAALAVARPRQPVTLKPVYHRGPGALKAGRVGTDHLSHIDVPVLMIAGEDDRFWPASRMATLAAREPTIEALSLAGAGHLIQVPGLPPVTEVGGRPPLRAGGDPATAYSAHETAWQRTVEFLHGLQAGNDRSMR